MIFSATPLLFFSTQAQAHRRDFPYTYDWAQPMAGAKEVELHETYDARDNTYIHAVEFEYGVNKRFMVAPYLLYGQGDGDGFHYQGFKVETRYQLGEYALNKVLGGLYAEYEKPKDESSELEGKIILSRYDDRGGDFSLNLITEKQQKSDAKRRYGLSCGYALPIGRRGNRAGLELIKDIDTGRVNAGPTFAFGPSRQTWVVAGVGLPINNRSGNKTQIRLLAEYEW